ncbi:hypothetical protein PAXRUDRAFT_830147 [Paxillus rubicundulus Ve08.2h10]|uniref:Uncharacterized protein n=1 Tax=Paxillus rubicundulus Ve08.2h10 TaxID=930991 RepID=A0A0D0D644_9AGAM|nr:hypothetical protein PAXRUDRAFT_830147 [Paxillus rubicundulus Ve08.2h10]
MALRVGSDKLRRLTCVLAWRKNVSNAAGSKRSFKKDVSPPCPSKGREKLSLLSRTALSHSGPETRLQCLQTRLLSKPTLP